MAFPEYFRFALAALATWRVTHLLVEEDGPADLVLRLRALFGQNVFGRTMDCFYCLSVWVAAPFGVAVTREASAWWLVWLGLSGAACLLERATASRFAEALETDAKRASK